LACLVCVPAPRRNDNSNAQLVEHTSRQKKKKKKNKKKKKKKKKKKTKKPQLT
jgi:hypothetical protein